MFRQATGNRYGNPGSTLPHHSSGLSYDRDISKVSKARRRGGLGGLTGGAHLESPRMKQRLLDVLKLGTVVAIFVVLFLFWRYETHVEIQFYDRGWVRTAIKTVEPLSGYCFAQSQMDQSSYNLTLADSPNYLSLNPGIALPFGSDCFDFASTIPSTPIPGQVLPERTIYHTYWRADLVEFGERQKLTVLSILKTQDPETSHLVIWTNSATLSSHPTLHEIILRYPSRISVRVTDIPALANTTPLAESHLIKSTDDAKGWVDGDLVRLLVIWNFGGVWVDMDSLMTRDMRPLLEQEWVTAWDCYDKPYQPLNGAMMHFYSHSPYLCELFYAMSTGPAPRPSTTDWGSFLYHKVFRRLVASGVQPFKILPYCFTDGRNCRLDSRLPDPFEGGKDWVEPKSGGGKGGKVHRDRWKDLEKKVASVFSIHLHNQWEKTFPKNGWINKMVVERLRLDE